MSQKINKTPNMYNGLKVRLLVDVKDAMDVFGERIFKAGTEGVVTKFSPVLNNVTIKIGDKSVTINAQKTEIVY